MRQIQVIPLHSQNLNYLYSLTHTQPLFHVHASCSTASAASERPQSLCCLPCWTVWDSVRCPLACWAARASTPHPMDPNCRCEARVALAMRPCREAKGGCTASQAPSHADRHQTSPLHQDSAVLPATSNIQMLVLLGRGIIISLLHNVHQRGSSSSNFWYRFVIQVTISLFVNVISAA